MKRSEKKKIVCCVDDERAIPHVIGNLVARRKDPGVHFFQLVMGSPEPTVKPSDEPVDILAALDRGESESPPLSVVGIAETIKAIQQIGRDSLEILFVCDLILENVRWPIDEDDAREFDQLLTASAEKRIFYSPVRPGIYVLYKLSQAGFNYVLTSALRPTFTDLPIKQPLDSSGAKPDAVTSMVERCYTREFGFSRTWHELASSEHPLLGSLNEQLGLEPFMNDQRHDVENIVRLKSEIDNSMRQACLRLLTELSVSDTDIEDAQLKLDKQDSISWALGVTKAVAVLRRIEPKTYLFDLLDVVRRKETHRVEVNGEAVRNMGDLEPIIHSNITLPLSHGMSKLAEFFKDAPDSQFSWHHRVQVYYAPEDGAGNKMHCVYEVVVTPNGGKNHPINLYKLLNEGPGNGSRTYGTMSQLFESAGLKLVVVRQDFQEEISQLTDQGLFLLVRRTDENYELRLVGRREFGAR